MSQLDNFTFDLFGVHADGESGYAGPIVNFDRLNTAILSAAAAGQPLHGLNKIYPIAKGDVPGTPRHVDFINFVTNALVICAPGCKISRPHDFDSGNTGVVRGGTNGAPIFNARWIGAEFIGEKDGSNYPAGHVFRIIGDDVWIIDTIVNGFGQEEVTPGNVGAIAYALLGNRIRLINPRTLHPHPLNGAGVRVFGGRGFRCLGGEIASGGDAALQFSTGALDGATTTDPGPDPVLGIFDGAYIGTTCTAENGRLMLVGTSDTPIEGVRYERILREVTADPDSLAGVSIYAQTPKGRCSRPPIWSSSRAAA